MLLSIVYMLFYAVCGLILSLRLPVVSSAISRRVWLGLVLGLFGSIWCPSLFSFLLGRFAALSHVLGALAMAALTAAALFFFPRQRLWLDKSTLYSLLWLLPLFIIGAGLFSTHILEPKADGVYVGQTTYGDLAMHLGFITSLGTQGTFPPEYSIFPGHAVNYPFLCEVPSASLYMMGCPLRWAYLIPALYAYVLVLLGVYFTARAILKGTRATLLAVYLFFIGGGFGFAYFLDGLKGASTVAKLINEGFATNLSALLNGFYVTPTNLPRIGLRWVNPIVDMLIPQRATLFGWAFVFPCLYLLLRFTFERDSKALWLLIPLSGGLPLIHTHSFLALGIVSGVYCLMDVFRRFEKKRLINWAIYGLAAILLAAPQLFAFAFRQAGESGMVQLHFNWANEFDGFLWFYVKNLGWLFLLLPFALLLLSRRYRHMAAGFLVLWLLSELVIFQPNTYDNNKLIFLSFFCLCVLSAKLLTLLFSRLNVAIGGTNAQRAAALHTISLVLLCGISVFLLSGFKGRYMDQIYWTQAGILTVVFCLLLLLYCQLRLLITGVHLPQALLTGALGFCALSYLLYRLYTSPEETTLSVSVYFGIGCVLLTVGLLVLHALPLLKTKRWPRAGAYLSATLLSFLLGFSLFLSGPLTILREMKSSYRMFGNEDLAAAAFIKEQTEPDALFLTDDSWHLNPVSVLTGRSILCGPDLFLYYHGIDTYARHQQVAMMLDAPGENEDLFRQYGVQYVYIGNSERSNHRPDEAWFAAHAECIYDQDGIRIYALGDV